MENTKTTRRERQPMRRILAVLAVLGVALVQPRPSAAESGRLVQFPPPHACTREDGDGVLCRDAIGINGAFEPGISPDGKSVYVPGFFGATVAVFARNTSTGRLTQLAAPNGCIARDGDGVTCTDVNGLSGPSSAVVSPDGKYVYTGGTSGIGVFARDRSTGALTQLAGTDGCFAHPLSGTLGCTDLTGFSSVAQLAFSADGKTLYAASRSGDAVGVFARDRLTGVLTQLPPPAGCIAENGDGISCTDGVGLDEAQSVVVSRNGKNVYVASSVSDAVAVFERDRTSGALTQLPAPMGCLAENGDGVTCTDAVGLNGAASVAMTKTARQVYVASSVGNTLAIFARNPATGVLTQLPGPDGCVENNGDGVDCRAAVAMGGPTSIKLTENGKSAYVTSPNSNSVVVFARDKRTGALTQLAAPNGCMSASGDGVTCTGAIAASNLISLAIPKNGKSVYATAYSTSTIVSFEREP